MRRWSKRIFWSLATLIGLPLVAALVLYVFSDTGIGRSGIVGLTGLITGGKVSIADLDGSFPNSLRARHVEIRDHKGVWLTLDDVALEWSPWGFLSDDVQIASVRARRATLLRFPVSDNPNPTPDTTRYEIASLDIAEVQFGKELTGRAIAIALKGHGHYTNGADAQWVLSAAGIGSTGNYASAGRIDGNTITASLDAREPLHGLLASLAGLPDLGATVVHAQIAGPRNTEAVTLALDAGPARVRAQGGLDLVNRTADLDVTANSPAMTPRRDLSWQSLAFDGHLHGSFSKPVADGHLSVVDLNAFGGGAKTIGGTLTGEGGTVRFDGKADGVRIPGREPNVLAAAPLTFALNALLDRDVPVLDFTASHPLVAFKGRASFAEHIIADATLTLARVAPFAELGGIDIDGRAALTAHLDTAAAGDLYSVTGTINAAGPALLSRLLGHGAQIAVTARTNQTGFALDKGHIASSGLKLDAQGALRDGALDFTYTATVPDMSRVLNTLSGNLSSQGRIAGTADNFTANATASGSLATKGYERGPVTLTLSAQNLPGAATGTLDAQGRFDAAPLRLSAAFDPHGANTHHIALKTLEWRSVRGNGDFTVPDNFRSVAGHTEFHVAQLADIGLLIDQSLKGALNGAADIASQNGRATGTVHATANGLAIAGIDAQALAIDGRVDDPFGKAGTALTLKANGLAISGVTGSANAQVNGPLDALRVTLNSDLKNGIEEIPLVADATLNLDNKTATLARLETTYRGEPFRLTAPAHAEFGSGLAVDRLQLLSNSAEITVAGRITPMLGADVTLRNASPELVRIFVPSFDAEGIISAQAKLTGTLEAPGGTVALQATGLRVRGVASGLLPATVTANGTLHGKTMMLTARIDAGPSAHLALDGSVPLQASGAFDLAASGTVDLVALDPILAANGRRLRGQVTIDGRFTGSFANPRAAGTGILANGEFDDFPQGIRVLGVAARLEAKGDTITISQLSGRAGRGTVSGSGTIALWADGIPIDLDITLKNARPVATDLFTADLDANLKVTGKLRDKLTLSGTANIDQGEINIAESYPSDVAVLDVRRSRNAPAPPRPPQPLSILLDLKVTAPSRIHVRGRGLDAEAGGTLTVKGLSTAPIVNGGFTIHRGELSLGGSVLRFTSGKITFDGRSLNGSFDPALDFAAESTTGSVTAKLAITGHASSPSIALSSTPNLPQDEVLAHLLFGRSISQLSPFQLAQIAQAFAELGGFGGGFNPLNAVRRTLGLDRLAVGAAASGTGATVEVGKNIGRNIYIGAKQDTAGGTQAIVQIDLTEHLKLQSTVTAVASAAPTTPTATPQENGSSIGVTYEFEY